MRLEAVVLLVVAFAAAGGVRASAGERPVRLLDETGAMSDPLAPGGDIRVFVFVRPDCPIANRYAPELQRLQQSFAGRAVSFFLVYVDPQDTADRIEAHQREFSLRLRWFVDDRHALAQLMGATVTPEAAVYSAAEGSERRRLYLGRIDDRVADVGRVRPRAATHELRDAIAAALEGRRPSPAGGPAIGCFIEDAR